MPILGIVEVVPQINLAEELLRAIGASQIKLQEYDIVVVAQKIVSKSEGRWVDLHLVTPSVRAHELARVTGKDPRLIEVILSESTEIVRAEPKVLIVRHRLGFVMANAGIDASNVARESGRELVLLLPRDPDAAASELRARLSPDERSPFGIIVSDSFGRPWRRGVVNVALGAAGIPAIIDRRGEFDRGGRKLEVTEIAFADSVAASAGILMGEAAESVPAVVVRGARWTEPERAARSLIRPPAEDLFR